MADENAEVAEGTEEEKPKKAASGKSPVVTLLLILNLVLMSAIAFFQFQAMEREKKRETTMDLIAKQMEEAGMAAEGDETNKPVDQKGKLFPLEGFVANLAQGDGPRRYLRLKTVLKFSEDSKEDEFTARKPQIRDTIISIINSKRPEDLLKKEGKVYLKEEIKAGINSFLMDGKVEDIYYVGFQIN